METCLHRHVLLRDFYSTKLLEPSCSWGTFMAAVNHRADVSSYAKDAIWIWVLESIRRLKKWNVLQFEKTHFQITLLQSIKSPQQIKNNNWIKKHWFDWQTIWIRTLCFVTQRLCMHVSAPQLNPIIQFLFKKWFVLCWWVLVKTPQTESPLFFCRNADIYKVQRWTHFYNFAWLCSQFSFSWKPST